ncbi:MAG TPA: TonB family protein [Thermoanaerobaculia bacterium]|nr:TonB family protein [Thermoanaerobaculia bacterium]
MDAVGSILAEREKERFPWGSGASLALLLHMGVAAALIVSGAKTVRFAPTRAVSVRLLPAGALQKGVPVSVPAPEPEKPKIQKPPPEEPPPPPTEKAKLLPAKEEKKKPQRPAPPSAPAAKRPAAAPQPAGSSDGSQAGSGTGSAGVGVGIGGARFDQPDFNYSYYAERISAAIGMNWFKPATSVPVNPVVHFRIARDGTISDAEITTSSTLPYVDRAALRAILASSPLPPLPSEFPGSSVGVSVVFE